MPEGPEIRRAADKIAAALCAKPLHYVWFQSPDLQAYCKTLQASRVCAVHTKGKALLTSFDCGLTLYSHNQLYGRWYISNAGYYPETNRSLRLELQTAEQSALLYSATDIAILETDTITQHPFIARAGIDILSDKPTKTELIAYLKKAVFARRRLGNLLLDQGFIAGCGNYLRSEILFASGLHYQARLIDLNTYERQQLANQIIRLLNRAYTTGGITNSRSIVCNLKKQGLTFESYRHFVFSRAGQQCHLCRTSIKKNTVAGRRLYWCPNCQPEETA